jgi:hypothetical protein
MLWLVVVILNDIVAAIIAVLPSNFVGNVDEASARDGRANEIG